MSTLAEPTAQRLRVFVGEANRMASQLIAHILLGSRAHFDVQAFSGTSSDVLSEIKNCKPHVSLISADLQDGAFTGFKVLRQLRAFEPRATAVMLLDSGDRETVVDAFRAGARGVFCRGNSFTALPKCIRRVHEGQIWASTEELDFVIDIVVHLKPLQIHGSGGMALLTSREIDVAHLVVEGMRNQEIAAKLKVTEHTVRNYMFRIFDKLGISSRVELVLYALSLPQGQDDHKP